MVCRYDPRLDRNILSVAEEMQSRFQLVDCPVKIFDGCIEILGRKVPKSKTKIIKVLKGLESDAVTTYDRIYELEARKCDDTDCVAAVPEWWQVRVGANRPQLAIVYADIKPDGKRGKSRWTLHIPHFNGAARRFPALTGYQKGEYFAKATLKDNSKILVYAASEAEAQRVCDELLNLVDPAMKPNPLPIHLGRRRGESLSSARVEPVSVQFYSKGRENMRPDWVVDK